MVVCCCVKSALVWLYWIMMFEIWPSSHGAAVCSPNNWLCVVVSSLLWYGYIESWCLRFGRQVTVLQSALPSNVYVLLCQICFGITILNHECRGLPVNSQVWIRLFEIDQHSCCVGSRCCSLLSQSMVVCCCVKSSLSWLYWIMILQVWPSCDRLGLCSWKQINNNVAWDHGAAVDSPNHWLCVAVSSLLWYDYIES